MSETKHRLLSAILVLPPVLIFILFDHFSVDLVFYFIALTLLSSELHRFSSLLSFRDKWVSTSFIFLTGVVQLLCVYVDRGKYFETMDQVLVSFMGVEIFLFLLIYLRKTRFDQLFSKLQMLVFTLFFTNFFISFFIKLKYVSIYLSHDRFLLTDLEKNHLPQLDNYFLLYVIVTVWCYDSFAYFTGKFWGKKKLGLSISPNKTWVGLYSGILASPLGFFLVKGIVQLRFSEVQEPSFFSDVYWGVLASVMIAVICQIGDLLASLIKRSVGVKDSGFFLKGHGGFLDRIDSLIAACFFFYYFLLLFYF